MLILPPRAVAAALGWNFKVPHARHELPGVVVAFGRDGGANGADLRDLWGIAGRLSRLDGCQLHTTLPVACHGRIDGLRLKAGACPEGAGVGSLGREPQVVWKKGFSPEGAAVVDAHRRRPYPLPPIPRSPCQAGPRLPHKRA